MGGTLQQTTFLYFHKFLTYLLLSQTVLAGFDQMHNIIELFIVLQKNYESVISQYKKKLEDAQELRKKLKAMEDKNMMYMQQNMDLEEVGVVIVVT